MCFYPRYSIKCVAIQAVAFSVFASAMIVPCQAFVQDAATGFGIRLPEPFVAEQLGGRSEYDVGFGIISKSGKPQKYVLQDGGGHLCQASFKAVAINASISRQARNALIDGPEWVDQARATFEPVLNISLQQRFTIQGYRGIEFQGHSKTGGRLENFRFFISIADTQKGRVVLSCVTSKDDYPKALRQFRNIRANLILPK
ncbi:MAG: hypothetical protein ACRCWF_01340 [Beijerinckiaceae bacterium]